ncbi:MAG: TadE/TadG family type IV pilus assembly protein [Hyphomicrobiales bacterium]
MLTRKSTHLFSGLGLRIGKLPGSSFRRDERGVAAVEAAMILPLFVGIALGIVDYGGLFYLRHEMNMVANEVTRGMALGQMSLVEAESRAAAMLPEWGGVRFTITASEPTADEVKMEISVPTEEAALANFVTFGLGGTMGVSSIKLKM